MKGIAVKVNLPRIESKHTAENVVIFKISDMSVMNDFIQMHANRNSDTPLFEDKRGQLKVANLLIDCMMDTLTPEQKAVILKDGEVWITNKEEFQAALLANFSVLMACLTHVIEQFRPSKAESFEI